MCKKKYSDEKRNQAKKETLARKEKRKLKRAWH